MVEYLPSKQAAAGSIPVFRSIVINKIYAIKNIILVIITEMAAWPSGKAGACKAFIPSSNLGAA